MNKRSYKKYIDRSQAMVVLLELERSLNVLALALTEDNDILVAANPLARTEKDSWKWSLFISIWVDPSRKSGLIRS